MKEKRIHKFTLPLWGSLLLAVLLAGCITLLALWCQPNALRTVLVIFRSQPLLIVLNALPVGLLLLTFAFLFKNVFYGAALVNFFVCALSRCGTSRCSRGTLRWCGKWAAPCRPTTSATR